MPSTGPFLWKVTMAIKTKPTLTVIRTTNSTYGSGSCDVHVSPFGRKVVLTLSSPNGGHAVCMFRSPEQIDDLISQLELVRDFVWPKDSPAAEAEPCE